MKQVVGFVEDNQLMLEEIFFTAVSSFFQSEVDWTLPSIYNEYTEDGHLIVHSIQNSSFTGSDFKGAISKTNNKSEIRQDAVKASGGCLATINLFGYNFKGVPIFPKSLQLIQGYENVERRNGVAWNHTPNFDEYSSTECLTKI